MVHETFYASHKHIFIQCSHETKIKEANWTQLNFHTKLVEQIAEKYGTVVKSSVERRRVRPSLEGNIRHFLIIIPPTDNKDKPTRRCIVCHKYEQRKESRYFCRQYNEPFCVVPCFERYHTMKQY